MNLSLPDIHVDRAADIPLQRQIYDSIRDAILAGKFRPGVRLPSSRDLARSLGVSRNTVLNVFDLLLSEGYLESRVGAGTWVSKEMPVELLRLRSKRCSRISYCGARTLSARGSRHRGQVTDITSGTPGPFRLAMPAVDEFPVDIWRRLLVRQLRRSNAGLLAYDQNGGHQHLREAIASHLGVTRGVRCHPDQVIVVSGSQQALDITARLLIDPGDPVLIEDPCYSGTKALLEVGGAELIPVPLDDEGFDVKLAASSRPDARMAFVTPACQFPLGVTMSMRRRAEVGAWMREAEVWTVEDDYDSEFRYDGEVLPALQGMDESGRVIYIGSFSKVLVPALRVGYLVVPSDLADAFVSSRLLSGRNVPAIEQAVLAEFIAGGYLARHTRRMRELYWERQQVLVHELHRELAGAVEIEPAPAGTHLVAWLQDGISDVEVWEEALALGVEAAPLSAYVLSQQRRPAIILGYASVGTDAIRGGVQALARAIETVANRNRAS